MRAKALNAAIDVIAFGAMALGAAAILAWYLGGPIVGSARP
jgi:hypothetical protein